MRGLTLFRASRTQFARILNQPALLENIFGNQVASNALASNPTSSETLGSAASLRSSTLHSYRPFMASSIVPFSLQVSVPPLGESITDGSIAAILKQPGDSVEEDEPIMQIETDKVTIDVRAPTSGTIEAILVSFKWTRELQQKFPAPIQTY